MAYRILIIDDDSSVRCSVKRALEVSGYAIVHAENGEHGLEDYKREDFDLLLLDLDLPELKGWEILEYATAHRPEIPVVLLTGMLSECEAGSFAGTDAVLEKPTDARKLLTALESALAESRTERMERLRNGFLKTPFLPAHGASPSPAEGLYAPGLPAHAAGRPSPLLSTEASICD